jgi:hypothetical protein
VALDASGLTQNHRLASIGRDLVAAIILRWDRLTFPVNRSG